MNQTFNAWLDFNERSEVSRPRDHAVNPLANLVTGGNAVPWVRQQLLHSQRNAPFLRVDFENLGLNFLAHGQNIGRAANPAPGDVADMQQAVDAPQINERAVIGKAAHLAADHIAFADFRVASLLGNSGLFFGHRAPVYDNVFFSGIDFQNAAHNLLTDQLLHFPGIAHTAL